MLVKYKSIFYKKYDHVTQSYMARDIKTTIQILNSQSFIVITYTASKSGLAIPLPGMKMFPGTLASPISASFTGKGKRSWVGRDSRSLQPIVFAKNSPSLSCILEDFKILNGDLENDQQHRYASNPTLKDFFKNALVTSDNDEY